MSLSEVEILRFSRHIILREVVGRGQRKLKEAHVLVAGLGAAGSSAALYLKAAGIGNMTLWDDCLVSPGDLAGSVVHAPERVGMPRARSAAFTLARLYQEGELTVLDREAELLMGLAAYDAIVLANGPWEAIIRGAQRLEIPVILTAAHRGEGAVTVIAPDGPCFDCLPESVRMVGGLYQEDGMGAVAPAAGVVGTMAAAEVIKRLLGVGEGLSGRILRWDGWDATVTEFVWGENCLHKTQKS
jgi:molybdopterin/thiamine biosynthesis adenylyltransferase